MPTPAQPAAAPARAIEQLRAIEAGSGDGALRLGGKSLRVTSLDKVFFPEPGFTKGDLMRYYAQVSPVLLPLLRGRPLSLKRYPDGVAGEFFFQQKAPPNAPPGVRVETVRTATGEEAERLVGGSLATLLYVVQLGCISLDPWHTTTATPEAADYAVIDLDPGPEAPFARTVQVARWVGEEMERLGLRGAPKTSGSRGIHIYLPLPRRTSAQVAARLAARLAERIAERHPREATTERALDARAADAVYVDAGQNDPGKTVAAAYAVRPRPEATVSTPLEWRELTPRLDPGRFTLASVPARIARRGDLWGAALRRRNTPRAVERALG